MPFETASGECLWKMTLKNVKRLKLLENTLRDFPWGMPLENYLENSIGESLWRIALKNELENRLGECPRKMPSENAPDERPCESP